MYTLLLIDGCHYISAGDANRIAAALREGCESVQVVAHVTAMRNERKDTRVAVRDVIRLIAHDVPRAESPAQPVPISSARAKRAGRSGSLPFSAR